MLVSIKNCIFGRSDERKPLLPTGHGRQNDGDDADTDRSVDTWATQIATGAWVAPRVLSDAIIGLSDGLTVPFALTAGLSSLGSSKVVITGGMAELVSGAISMGLGGYLAAVGESEYYQSQVEKETHTFETDRDASLDSLKGVLSEFELSDETVHSFVQDLEKTPDDLVSFILKIGKGMDEPAEKRELTSALTIGLAYFAGGFIPLVPYFFTNTVQTGLYISIGVMAVTLFMFGVFKTISSVGSDTAGNKKIIMEGVKMMFLGGFAAACAWGLVRVIDN